MPTIHQCVYENDVAAKFFNDLVSNYFGLIHWKHFLGNSIRLEDDAQLNFMNFKKYSTARTCGISTGRSNQLYMYIIKWSYPKNFHFMRTFSLLKLMNLYENKKISKKFENSNSTLTLHPQRS